MVIRSQKRGKTFDDILYSCLVKFYSRECCRYGFYRKSGTESMHLRTLSAVSFFNNNHFKKVEFVDSVLCS